MEKIIEHYNKFNEDKRLKSRHGQVEFLVSMDYIHRELNAIGENAKILDVGAATGAYSIPLSEEGYEVHAIELVKHNVNRLKAKGSRVIAKEGNALKLSKKYEKEYFDFVLVFGPMYHMFSYEDRLKVLEEAKKVTKSGGIIMVAYLMQDYAVVKHGFMEGTIKESFENKKVNHNYEIMSTKEDLYSYISLEEAERLKEAAGLTRKYIFTPDGPANYIRPALREMDEEAFNMFVEYVKNIAERTDMLGAAAHTVDVLIK